MSFDPRTGETRGVVAHTTPSEVERALARATLAATEIAATSPMVRQAWLSAVADALIAHSESLAQLADEETGLGRDRLRGEIAGAARSALFYANVAVEGSFFGACTDTVNETTTLSRWNIPVGPVAVFGASNFPFGFGVFGHDVASAIAAGCPVIAKAHPAHPRLSVRIAALARDALASAHAPDGTYDLVIGFDAGLQLVDAPAITTVAFTGSQRGGMALLQRAGARGIPVFAEMGTVNPVVVTAAAARSVSDAAAIAAGFVASFTLGAGQFCTKPGLIFAPAGSQMFRLVTDLVAAVPPAPLLSAGIAASFDAGVEELSTAAGMPHPAPGTGSHGTGSHGTGSRGTGSHGYVTAARVLPATLDALKPGSRLLDECFGPVAIVCEYTDADAVLKTLSGLQGSLAASVFTAGPDDTDAPAVVAQLLTTAGRVAINSWPTGVANTWSQHHGGPWPATSRPEATSVGAGALNRFVRPVTLQNADRRTLPIVLAPENPWRIPRRIDGVITLPAAPPTTPRSPKVP